MDSLYAYGPLIFIAAVFVFLLVRYGIIAGGAFAIARLMARVAPHRRIQALPISKAQIRREIAYSISTSLIFAGVFWLLTMAGKAGLTQIYHDVADYGWLWFVLSIPVMLLLHDLYFYVAHRLMHTKLLFERVHRVHHLSTNPTPFAAFAFHPVEAVIEAGIVVLIVFLMPVHLAALGLFLLISLLENVLGHLGYEFYPSYVARSPIGRWLNTSTYHNEHHRRFTANYGLYTVIWDRLFGTLHAGSERLFARLSGAVPKERTDAAGDAPAAHPHERMG